MDAGPLPPPPLSRSDDDGPSAKALKRRRKHLSELRHNLRASSPHDGEPREYGLEGAEDDSESTHSSLGLRDRITAKLSRPATVNHSTLRAPTFVISVRDSRSQDLGRDSSESKDLFRWAVMVENQRGCVLSLLVVVPFALLTVYSYLPV